MNILKSKNRLPLKKAEKPGVLRTELLCFYYKKAKPSR